MTGWITGNLAREARSFKMHLKNVRSVIAVTMLLTKGATIRVVGLFTQDTDIKLTHASLSPMPCIIYYIIIYNNTDFLLSCGNDT